MEQYPIDCPAGFQWRGRRCVGDPEHRRFRDNCARHVQASARTGDPNLDVEWAYSYQACSTGYRCVPAKTATFLYPRIVCEWVGELVPNPPLDAGASANADRGKAPIMDVEENRFYAQVPFEAMTHTTANGAACSSSGAPLTVDVYDYEISIPEDLEDACIAAMIDLVSDGESDTHGAKKQKVDRHIGLTVSHDEEALCSTAESTDVCEPIDTAPLAAGDTLHIHLEIAPGQMDVFEDMIEFFAFDGHFFPDYKKKGD